MNVYLLSIITHTNFGSYINVYRLFRTRDRAVAYAKSFMGSLEVEADSKVFVEIIEGGVVTSRW